MEVIYPIGRVYKLISSNGLVYIGSTKQPLHIRLTRHIYIRNTCSSKSLFENNSKVDIELIEEHSNISKYDLRL